MICGYLCFLPLNSAQFPLRPRSFFLFFGLAGQFVFLVTLEAAPGCQICFEPAARPMEPDLHVVQGDVQDIGDLLVLEALDVLKSQCRSVFLRKTVDESANSRVRLFSDGDLLDGPRSLP